MTIRNDATRQSVPVAEPRPLRGVLARQGQVLLDTDINELERTALARIESADAAMLGPPDRLLYPAGTPGFQISGTAPDFEIGVGSGYLNGWQLANTANVTLLTQPNPWNGAPNNVTNAFAIKALVRHIDPAEDSALCDVALGDAQASGRALNDWQVLTLAVAGGASCATILQSPEWQALSAPSTGTLAFVFGAASVSTDPCSLTPAGGQSRFENLLYRIEVHGGTVANMPADGPRFGVEGAKIKLSRRNASLMARITNINGNVITVSPPALDPLAWFSAGAYAEIVGRGDDIDPTAALANERLFKVSLATDAVITLSATTAQIAATAAQTDGQWFLRLWDALPDGTGYAVVPAGGGPIDLGDGVLVQLGGGASALLRRGDYWTAPVRSDGSVSWPGIASGTSQQQTPHGPETRYAPLAVMPLAPDADCRIPFATLTDRALLYRGGDGQSIFAVPATAATPVALPQKLRVAVMRGATPAVGATVLWRTPAGAIASWINSVPVPAAGVATSTDTNGLVEVEWDIDAQNQAATHQIEAVLLDAGVPAQTPTIQFNARFDSAAKTSYTPGTCPTLAQSTDVQSALDALCAALTAAPNSLGLTGILLTSAASTTIDLIAGQVVLNAKEVPYNAFVAGITFETTAADLLSQLQVYDPAVEIAIDLPYPATDPDRNYWAAAIDEPPPNRIFEGVPQRQQILAGTFGYQTIRLDGTVVAKGNAIIWQPTSQAAYFLTTALQHRFGTVQGALYAPTSPWATPPITRVLCRIRVRSALIFADDPVTKQRLWLNAGYLGTNAGQTGRELTLGAFDIQKAGDLDMFIWLTLDDGGIIFYFGGELTITASSLGTPQAGYQAVLAAWQSQMRTVILDGYADATGDEATNLRLSEDYADAVKTVLVNFGIPQDAYQVQPHGNTEPPSPPLQPGSANSPNRIVKVSFGDAYATKPVPIAGPGHVIPLQEVNQNFTSPQPDAKP
jgi:hypothetical protein